MIIFSLAIITDHHLNRINMPFLAGHRASLSSVFIPTISVFKPLYEGAFDLSDINNKSFPSIGCYIGLASNFAIILGLFLTFFFYLKGKRELIKKFIPIEAFPYIFSSILLLLYSMAIPLQYLPEDVVNKIPLIKQFSGLWRFGWAFYYVIVVACIVLLHRFFSERKWGQSIVYIFIFLYFIEGMGYHLKISKEIALAPNGFNKNFLTLNQKILTTLDEKNFQAILPIPYYFLFSVPFGKNFIDAADASYYSSMVASYHNSMPIMSTYLSRPSVSETMNIFKQLMPYPYQKPITNIISDGRDIAVVVQVKHLTKLDENELEILKKSTLLFQNNEIQIYRLTIESLQTNNKPEREKNYAAVKPYLKVKNGVKVSDTSEFFIYYNFDTCASDISYTGKSSFYGKKENYNMVYEASTSMMDTSIVYNLSFYYYNHVWDQTFNSLVINEKDSAGADLQFEYISPLEVNQIDGWWYFYERNIKIKSNKSKLSIFFKGENKFENWFATDNFLLKPNDLDVWYEAEKNDTSVIYYNNKKYFEESK